MAPGRVECVPGPASVVAPRSHATGAATTWSYFMSKTALLIVPRLLHALRRAATLKYLTSLNLLTILFYHGFGGTGRGNLFTSPE